MCEDKGCCCGNPEELKSTPAECTDEQISKCHGDVDEHPCEKPAEDK